MGDLGKSRGRRAWIIGVVGIGALLALGVWWMGRGSSARAKGEEADPHRAAEQRQRATPEDVDTPDVREPDEPIGALRLEGQVLDEAGAPVGDAMVAISTRPPRTTRSQADGSFAFDQLTPRGFTVQARTATAMGSVEHRLTAESDPAIVRMRRATRVHARVMNEEGQPIAGAEVSALWDRELEELTPFAITDAAGEATLDALPGSPVLRAVAAGYAPGGARALQDVSERGEVSVEIRLGRGVTISGRVIDEHKRPIAGASVFALEMGGAFDLDAPRNTVHSDREGRFRLAVMPRGGFLVLSASSPQHTEGRPTPLDRIAKDLSSGDVTGVELTLRTAGAMAGLVVLPSGAPAPFATVTGASKGGAFLAAPRTATADAEGRFELSGVPRGPLLLRATTDGASSAVLEVSLADAARQDDVRLVLDITGELSGVVVDERGEPVPEVSVTAYPQPPASLDDLSSDLRSFAMTRQDRAITDASGAFTLRGLPDEPYHLAVEEDRMMGRSMRIVTARPGDAGVKLVHPRAAAILGRVVGPGGQPLAAPAYVKTTTRRAVHTATGAFRLEPLEPGRYELVLSSRGLREQRLPPVTLAAGQTLDLGAVELGAGRRVHGRVVDSLGRPIAGAKVLLAPFRFTSLAWTTEEFAGDNFTAGLHTVTSDDQGRFEIRGLGEAELHLTAMVGKESSPFASVPAGADEPSPLTLTVHRHGSLEGTVTRKGAPVAKVTVTVRPRVRPSTALVHPSAITDERGRFAIDKLSEGEHDATVSSRGAAAIDPPSPLVVTAGQRAQIELRLGGGALSLSVEAKAQRGHRVDAADLALFAGAIKISDGKELFERARSADIPRFTMWSPHQVATFTELRAGTYSLCALPFTGELNDAELVRRAIRAHAKRPAFCKTLTMAETPALQKVELELPSMPTLPQ